MAFNFQTLREIGAGDKPTFIIFNKIDAYTWVEKEADDLTPMTKENYTLEDLKRTWMANPSPDPSPVGAGSEEEENGE